MSPRMKVDNEANERLRSCRIRVDSIKPKLRIVPAGVETIDPWDDAGFVETMLGFARANGRQVVAYNMVAVDSTGHCFRGGKLRSTRQTFALLGGMVTEVYRLAKWINDVQT